MARLAPRVVVVVSVFLVAAAAAAQVPVVVAVDTSRSLSPAELTRVRGTLAETSALLPADTPLGLVAFNDEARWLVEVGGSPADLDRALAQLAPSGSYTVLHDALFLSARELQGGGVVVVLSDGRDENSATTLEDVGRLCEANRVRVVAASVGGRVDERGLRRLALLSQGTYVGRLGSLTPAELVAPVADARGMVREEIGAAARAQRSASGRSEPSAEETEPQPMEKTTPAEAPVWWLYLVLAAAVVAAVAVAWGVSRRRRDHRSTWTCEVCGAELEGWETTCSRCQLRELEKAMEERPQERADEVAEDTVLDPSVFAKQPLPEGLEHTMVLDEQPVLVVRQRGRASRTFALPPEGPFAVGRAPEVNTLQVDDPTVSAQHLKIVPKSGAHYVVDLETTNGTSVNHERVRVRRLHPGDVIRAGAVEMEYGSRIRRVS